MRNWQLLAVGGLLMSAVAVFAQAESTSASLALEAIRSQRNLCAQQKDVGPRAKCFENVAELALKLLDSTSKARSAASPAAPQDAWLSLVSEGLAYLTRSFKDPMTVRYRDLTLSGSGEQPTALCGEVNGRNSYGAYVGFKRFYVLLPALASEIEDPKTGVVSKLWPDFCARKLAEVELGQEGVVTISRVAAVPNVSPVIAPKVYTDRPRGE